MSLWPIVPLTGVTITPVTITTTTDLRNSLNQAVLQSVVNPMELPLHIMGIATTGVNLSSVNSNERIIKPKKS